MGIYEDTWTYMKVYTVGRIDFRRALGGRCPEDSPIFPGEALPLRPSTGWRGHSPDRLLRAADLLAVHHGFQPPQPHSRRTRAAMSAACVFKVVGQSVDLIPSPPAASATSPFAPGP